MPRYSFDDERSTPPADWAAEDHADDWDAPDPSAMRTLAVIGLLNLGLGMGLGYLFWS